MKLSLTRIEAENLERTLRWVLVATRSSDDDQLAMIKILDKIRLALKYSIKSNQIELEVEK